MSPEIITPVSLCSEIKILGLAPPANVAILKMFNSAISFKASSEVFFFKT